jgi:hypothetical protein
VFYARNAKIKEKRIMGARGPRKKLKALVDLEGDRNKHGEIYPDGIESYGEPYIGEHLPDDARGCIEIIKQSMPPGIYSALDSDLLHAFSMACAEHKRCVIEITHPNFEHVLTNSKTGVTTLNPWLKSMNVQAMLIATLGDRLGLNPKARQAMKMPGANQTNSEFDGLIGNNYKDQSDLSESSTILRS